MPAPSRFRRLADAPRFANVCAWRIHAETLRDSAETPALTVGQRTVLLRDAALAERLARAWGRRRASDAAPCRQARARQPMFVATAALSAVSNAASRAVRC